MVNVRDTASYVFYALYFTALPLLIGVGYIARHPGLLLSRLSTFVIIWIAPMFAFYILVHVGDPGYVFTILPALLVFGARAVAELKVSARLHLPKLHPGLQRALPPVLVIALVAGNVALSFQHPRPLTLNGIQAADDRFGRKIAYLRETFRASSDVLATYDSFRQLQYYLPWQKVVWIDIFDRREQTVALPQGTTKLILVDESLLPLAPESGEDIVLGGGRMRILVVPDGKHLRFVENKLKLE
ncbi:MAG: hypothetical protein HY675_14475 [Chloroflexi bacterium]|nr:hypothetical protein [Chloroflexota bacterium]